MSGDNDKTRGKIGTDVGTDEALTAAEDSAKQSTTTDPVTASETVDNVEQLINTTGSQHKKSRGAGLLTLVLLFTVIAVAALAWYGWTYYLQPQQQRLQVLEESLNRQLELSNQLNDGQQSAAKVSATTEKLLASLLNDQKLMGDRLESQGNRLRDLSGTSRNDWMLAEAEYLLRLASQRLLMERGTVGAQALLESADNTLRAIDDVGLFTVRDALAKDLMALKLSPTIDREGIYLKLAALINAVENLPAIPPAIESLPVQPTVTIEPPQTMSGEQKWYSQLLLGLKNIFSDLGQFVKIRHHDKPPEPLLSDQYQANLANNLRLMFEQSQLALLREQSTIYIQSLEQARQWLNQYYVHYPEKDILVEEINYLQQQPIVQVLPDISASLKQLTDYINRYHKLTPEKSVVEDSEQAIEPPLVPSVDKQPATVKRPLLESSVGKPATERPLVPSIGKQPAVESTLLAPSADIGSVGVDLYYKWGWEWEHEQ
jgi:uroporphyrin-III C-methyltransferase